jgi:hypothetical protein
MYFVVVGSVQLVGNKGLILEKSHMGKSTVHRCAQKNQQKKNRKLNKKNSSGVSALLKMRKAECGGGGSIFVCLHRPHDLLKMRTADSGGAEPYFGELSLFEEV